MSKTDTKAGKRTKIRTADRLRALELLGKTVGLFEAKDRGPGFTLVIANQPRVDVSPFAGPSQAVDMGAFSIDVPEGLRPQEP